MNGVRSPALTYGADLTAQFCLYEFSFCQLRMLLRFSQGLYRLLLTHWCHPSSSDDLCTLLRWLIGLQVVGKQQFQRWRRSKFQKYRLIRFPQEYWLILVLHFLLVQLDQLLLLHRLLLLPRLLLLLRLLPLLLLPQQLHQGQLGIIC